MKHALTLAAICVATSLQPALACGYDAQMDNPFTLAYPGSFSIALATQTAIANKTIPAITPLAGQAGLERSVRWLGQFRERLEAQQYQGKLSILLVDSGLWSRISEGEISAGSSLLAAEQRLRLETHSSAPTAEATLITSEATLAALLGGTLSLQDAKDAGLLRLNLRTPQDALGLK